MEGLDGQEAGETDKRAAGFPRADKVLLIEGRRDRWVVGWLRARILRGRNFFSVATSRRSTTACTGVV